MSPFASASILAALDDTRTPVAVVRDHATGLHGAVAGDAAPAGHTLHGLLPPIYPEWLGDPSFCRDHGVRFPYVGGAMANGIASAALVTALARSGCMGFFGSGGLSLAAVRTALTEIVQAVGADAPWGCNLIHSPGDPDREEALVDLCIELGVSRIEAAAFMSVTPAIVRFSVSGLHRDATGRIARRHHVMAKISRPEVARPFLEPAPRGIVESLLREGRITAEEAELAAQVPLAEDITVESDSGGHTDNRPLGALFPAIQRLRDDIAGRSGHPHPPRLGAAGGLGTPNAVAAAFSLGAAYVVTGSVNQACVESGLAANGKRTLSEAGIADTILAPSSDMFELGATVQVLRRGTLFGVRARRLHELYRSHASWEEIPAGEREKVERQILASSFEDAWNSTRDFWSRRDPAEIAKAEADPRHRMALVFRAYLGQASRWAVSGDPSRANDYQIWCGPAIGSFNAWTAGSFLEDPRNRTVEQVARNLLEGAAVVVRAQQLRSLGVPVPHQAFDFRPRPLS